MKDHRVTAETVVAACCIALAAAAVLPGTWFIPAAEAVLGLVAGLSVWAATGAALLSSVWAALGISLCAWSAWAGGRLWQATTIFAWGLITVCAVPLAIHGIRLVTPRAGPVPEPEPAEIGDGLTPEQRKLAEFDYMFERVGVGGVKTTQIQTERSGRVARLELPREGQLQSIGTLRNAASKIEVILKLREGSVSFYHGDHSADIWMRLREIDILADIVRLTADRLATTINEKFAVGVQENGNVAMITMRELHMLVVGLTGSGKSNLINVLVTQLASCRDTLVWMIDMKGGRTARPWLQAWVQGKTARPGLDWVATTRSEAKLMMEAFEAVIDERANSGIGGSKITPSVKIPQIILICDEMASLFGQNKGRKDMLTEDEKTNSWFISKAESLVQLARSEAVGSIWATQRGTVTMTGSGDLKANVNQRIALAAATANDARAIIPDNPHELKLLTSITGTKGAGLITSGSDISMLTKFFYHDHIDGQCSEGDNDGCVPDCPIWKSSIEVGRHRPELDRLTAGRLGDVYTNRWSRSGNLLRQASIGKAAQVGGTMVVDDSEDSFMDIMREGGMPDPESRLHPSQKRMREMLIDKGKDGSTAILLKQALEREGYEAARETVTRWLTRDAAQGLCHSVPGVYGRWAAGPGSEPADGTGDGGADDEAA